MCGCRGHQHGEVKIGCSCCGSKGDPKKGAHGSLGYDVTFNLGIRGTYTLFSTGENELEAVAKATLEADKYLAHGWYIDGVTCKAR